jgi:RecJ-like exonuclease
MHLPTQLAQVDPIVASFCGGGVGVLTALLIVEANNAKMQEKRRCLYCEGTGYLTCGACVGSGSEDGSTCSNCSGTGKVMCTSCLCTGKKLATEHDPRVDPWSLGMD